MKPGDVIRVEGRRGQRYIVKEIHSEAGVVDAVSDPGGLGSFAIEDCHVDRKATAARRELLESPRKLRSVG